jgi:hypothetical protein
MADDKDSSPSPSPRFPAWQRKYDAVLHEKDRARLFKCVEVAEAAVLLRLEAIKKDSDHHAERDAIADALNQLELLKKNRLGFDKG